MKNKNVFKKVSSLALAGAMFAGTLLMAMPASAVGYPIGTNGSTAVLTINNVNDKAVVDRGETVTYAIDIKNTGNVATTNTYLWINPLNLATFVSGSTVVTKSGVSVNVSDAWVNDGENVGTMQPGTEVLVTYKTTVAANANPDDVIWSVGTVRSDQTAQVTSSSYSRMEFKATALCAILTADKTTVAVGDKVNFSVQVCNNSTINLTQILVRDQIPGALTYVPGSTTLDINGQHIAINDSWQTSSNDYWINIGNLPAGQKATLNFAATVNSTLTDGQSIENTVQANAKELDKPVLCSVTLTGKVLGVVTTPPTVPTTPTQLPNTGPGDIMFIISGLVPAGYILKRFKNKI